MFVSLEKLQCIIWMCNIVVQLGNVLSTGSNRWCSCLQADCGVTSAVHASWNPNSALLSTVLLRNPACSGCAILAVSKRTSDLVNIHSYHIPSYHITIPLYYLIYLLIMVHRSTRDFNGCTATNLVFANEL